MKRSHLLALAGAPLAARALPAMAAAAATIRASTGAVEEFAQPYYAVQKGFFRDAGLTVDLSVIPGGGW